MRTKDALLRAADGALQQAKRDGGNRICVFQQQGYIYTPASVQPPVRRPASGARRTPGERDDQRPFRPPPSHSDHAASRDHRLRAAAAGQPKERATRVLVVDDEPTFGAAWRAFCMSVGFEVITAEDGKRRSRCSRRGTST